MGCSQRFADSLQKRGRERQLAHQYDMVTGIRLGDVFIEGRAVAAALPAYQASRIEIDTVSLPRNVEVPNGFQEVRAARGAVPRLDFQAGMVRRLMLYVRNEEGAPVAKGLGVYDHQGQYLTTVVDAGLIYLEDAPDVVRLNVTRADERICRLEFDTRQLPASTEPYDRLEVDCQEG